MPDSYQHVSAELVDANPFNARSFYDSAVTAALAKEIRLDGQLVAATAIPSSANRGRFTLVDGHYRLRAIMAAGLSTILLDVRAPAAEIELYRLSHTLNVHRRPHTVFDNALAWNRLLANGLVPTRGDLQGITGKSASTISKTLQLLELPAAVLETVRSQPSRFNLKLSYALVLLCKAGRSSEATRLAEKALEKELAPAEINQAIRWAQVGKVGRKSREASRKYPVEGIGCVGTIKSWQSGKVVSDLSFTEPARQAMFLEQLKNLISLLV